MIFTNQERQIASYLSSMSSTAALSTYMLSHCSPPRDISFPQRQFHVVVAVAVVRQEVVVIVVAVVVRYFRDMVLLLLLLLLLFCDVVRKAR